LSSNDNLSLRRLKEAGDEIQNRALATSGGADHGYEFATIVSIFDDEGKIMQSHERSEFHGHVPKLDDRLP
jgi:hypothetical protein